MFVLPFQFRIQLRKWVHRWIYQGCHEAFKPQASLAFGKIVLYLTLPLRFLICSLVSALPFQFVYNIYQGCHEVFRPKASLAPGGLLTFETYSEATASEDSVCRSTRWDQFRPPQVLEFDKMSLPLVFLYWYMYTNDFIEVVITRKFDRDFLLMRFRDWICSWKAKTLLLAHHYYYVWPYKKRATSNKPIQIW